MFSLGLPQRHRYPPHMTSLLLSLAIPSVALAEIDVTALLLQDAAGRTFLRWPVLGEYVWPNDFGAEDRTTYAEEVDDLKGGSSNGLTGLTNNSAHSLPALDRTSIGFLFPS